MKKYILLILLLCCSFPSIAVCATELQTEQEEREASVLETVIDESVEESTDESIEESSLPEDEAALPETEVAPDEELEGETVAENVTESIVFNEYDDTELLERLDTIICLLAALLLLVSAMLIYFMMHYALRGNK